MTPETDPKKIAAQLCQFARTNFVAEGKEFDENSPLSQAGIDSFALVELRAFLRARHRCPGAGLAPDRRQSGLDVFAGQLHRRAGA